MSPRARPQGCCRPTPVEALSELRQQRLIALFKALSDPGRLEMFRLINAQPEPVCVCDIVEHFDLSQPTVSHHLKVLREAGLLRMSKRGIWAFYSPDPDSARRLAEAAAVASSEGAAT